MLSSKYRLQDMDWYQLEEAMLIQLDESKTLYHQIYATIKDRILSGVLLIDTKMPSSRELATQLDVSRNIVLLAYEQLIAEGYLIELHPVRLTPA